MNYYSMDYYYKCNLLLTSGIARDPQNISGHVESRCGGIGFCAVPRRLTQAAHGQAYRERTAGCDLCD